MLFHMQALEHQWKLCHVKRAPGENFLWSGYQVTDQSIIPGFLRVAVRRVTQDLEVLSSYSPGLPNF